MTTALVLSCIAAAGLFVACLVLQRRLDLSRQVNDFNKSRSHAMCIAHVSHYVGNHFAADVLKAAAEAYNQPATQTELAVISHTQWAEGGPSIPALWMLNRADALRKEVDDV